MNKQTGISYFFDVKRPIVENTSCTRCKKATNDSVYLFQICNSEYCYWCYQELKSKYE